MRIRALCLAFSFLLGNIAAQAVAPDLRLLALRSKDAVVALALRNGKPLPGEALAFRHWTAAGERKDDTVRTDATGVAVLQLAVEGLHRTPVLVLREPGTCAVVPVDLETPEPSAAVAVTSHLFVDRPVYRPGETVAANLFVRRTEFVGDAAVPVSSPAAFEAVEVSARLPGGTGIERTVTTDLLGAASFTLTLPEDARSGPVSVQVRGKGFFREEVPFELRAYKRPSLHCAITAPPLANGDGPTPVAVSARDAAGSPAAGRQGTLRVANALEFPFTLDEHGATRILIPQARLAPLRSRIRVELRATVIGAEGIACHTEGSLAFRAGDELETPSAIDVGQVLTLHVRGKPFEVGLVAVAHRALLDTRVVALDRDGAAVVHFAVQASWVPRVEVRALGPADTWDIGGGRQRERLTLAVSPALTVEVEEAGRRFAPGATVELHVRLRYGAGPGTPGLLAVGVVDEQVFASDPDRTGDPREALAPALEPALRGLAAAHARTLSQALCTLSLLGWLHGWPVLASRPPGPGPGGPVCASPGSPSRLEPPPRTRFAATAAFFGALRTDPDGKATLRVTFPDDLTRWRVTVLAVDHGIASTLFTTHVSTEKDLSVSAALPRFLRVGDQVTAARIVHRKDREGTVAAASTGLRLAARGPGSLPVNLSIEEGGLRDALRTEVPVLEDLAWVPWSETWRVNGSATLVPPAGIDPLDPCELVVLPGREAILSEAARYVGEYPHGCVEQTTSRLLPLLSAQRCDATPNADRQAKIAHGMRRLRSLLLANDAGFRYWPGWDRVDTRMSAFVVHALCLARDVGVDLRRHELQLAPDRGPFAELAQRMRVAPGDLTEDEVALGIALARYAGPESRHAKALLALLQARRLPPRLLAAAALALPIPAARELLDRETEELDRAAADPECVALQILALRRVGAADERIATLESRVLRTSKGGRFGSTFATALVVAALHGSGDPRSRGEGFAMTLVIGGTTTEIAVTAGRREPIVVRLPEARGLSVRAPEGRDLMVLLRGRTRLTAERAEQASPHVLVERALVDARTGRDVRRFLAAGQAVTLRVTLRVVTEHSYVAVECPLPSGFEVDTSNAGATRGWDVHDERAVFAFESLARGVTTIELPLLAVFPGETSWPATTAVAMYEDLLCGHSAPEHLVVLAR